MKYQTAITKIEDEREFVRGYSLEELTTKKSFVETVYLVLRGELPTAAETRLLNALLTAAIDHGPGTASGQVARIVASAQNSPHTALAAGILAMGERHGGAIEGAARFFQENKETGHIAGLVQSLKEQKIRLPGYGHAVLTHDGRSDVLLGVAKETGFYGPHCALAEKIGAVLNQISSKPIPLNIDGAMAAILLDMGFDWRLTKGFFIIARVPGLVAHIYEEMAGGEGLRRVPEEEIEYSGPEPRAL